MISLKTSRELALMRQAGRVASEALRLAGEALRPGVSTWEVDRVAASHIEKCGAHASQLGYEGFPAATCVSVNGGVIHGIPSRTHILKEGDIVSIDLTVDIGGYHADNAATFAVGRVAENARRLMDVTRESMFEGIRAARAGARIGDISHAVQSYVEARGYSVVRDFVGHGVGASLHEPPEVPNFGNPGHGARLVPGMTITVEPMISAGRPEVDILRDKWTVVTRDGSLSAHFEHTIAIAEGGPVILTLPDGE